MTSNDSENVSDTNSGAPLRTQVESALQDYFRKLDGDMPSNLYKMVIQEIEPPLLAIVLHHSRGNQTRAAEILGINRGTLRKKLKQYAME
jgi:Fis family transcriptional regulator